MVAMLCEAPERGRYFSRFRKMGELVNQLTMYLIFFAVGVFYTKLRVHHLEMLLQTGSAYARKILHFSAMHRSFFT